MLIIQVLGTANRVTDIGSSGDGFVMVDNIGTMTNHLIWPNTVLYSCFSLGLDVTQLGL